MNIQQAYSSVTEWLTACVMPLGEDPLVDDQSDHDIMAVAGVLKLYFRGLETPLFPKERFLDLMSTISKYYYCTANVQ